MLHSLIAEVPIQLCIQRRQTPALIVPSDLSRADAVLVVLKVLDKTPEHLSDALHSRGLPAKKVQRSLRSLVLEVLPDLLVKESLDTGMEAGSLDKLIGAGRHEAREEMCPLRGHEWPRHPHSATLINGSHGEKLLQQFASPALQVEVGGLRLRHGQEHRQHLLLVANLALAQAQQTFAADLSHFGLVLVAKIVQDSLHNTVDHSCPPCLREARQPFQRETLQPMVFGVEDHCGEDCRQGAAQDQRCNLPAVGHAAERSHRQPLQLQVLPEGGRRCNYGGCRRQAKRLQLRLISSEPTDGMHRQALGTSVVRTGLHELQHRSQVGTIDLLQKRLRLPRLGGQRRRWLLQGRTEVASKANARRGAHLLEAHGPQPPDLERADALFGG
mmetsp:Transcript_10985/g.25069  ORF Transcript_10985/g.25069 Transcript_10985/m.25069 type:complete len:386 (+) Transcript_10985:589-1746(+)